MLRSGEAAPRGSAKVLAKIEAAVAAGNWYEAHQMYRTLAYRYSVQRNWSPLLELLHSGALRFLEAGQASSGGDLAQLYAEKLCESATPVSEAVLGRVESLLSKVPGPSESLEAGGAVDRAKLLDTTIAWSKAVASDAVGRRKGHPDVHARIAVLYWAEESWHLARRHFLLSNDGQRAGAFLAAYQSAQGYTCEIDMFCAQACLQFLANSKRPAARDCLQSYAMEHAGVEPKVPPYSSPLLNFVWLLLLAVEMSRLQEFTILVERYKPSLDRDPAYIDYVHKIGEVYFGLPPPSKPGAARSNFLSNLFSSFLNVDEEESDGDGEDAPTSSLPQTAAAHRPTTAKPSQQMQIAEDLD